MKKPLLFILAALALAVSCGGGESPGPGGPPDLPKTEKSVYGVVKDSGGNPIPDVVVSDGYSCVKTDAWGRYIIERHDDARFVYYSTPADCRVEMKNGLPYFYSEISEGVQEYDFSLRKLDAVEEKFIFFALGDPQVASTANINRFRNESAADIKAHAESLGLPCYGITLGDVVSDKPDLMKPMALAMDSENMGLPVFQIIGNHDHYKGASTDMAAARNFENVFGPLNHSFNRGNVHVIGMDNIVYFGDGDYDAGFTDDQFSWLKDDLLFVPRDKMVILCVHAPFNQGQTSGSGSIMNRSRYYAETLALLSQFAEARIVAGHTHNAHNYIHNVNGKEIYEHDQGVLCGAYWNSTVNLDGAPNGYCVFHIDGSTVENMYYKPVGYPADFQVRMYRAGDVFTGGHESWNVRFNHSGDDQVIASVWNTDNKYWRVNLYENDVYSGEMKLYTDLDAWSSAYYYGIGKTASSYRKEREHFYYYTLKDPSASVKVEAIDRYGNKYYQSEFTTPGPADYPSGY